MCLLGYGCRLSLGRGGRRRNPRGQWLRQTPCDHELRPPRERKAGHPQRAWRFPYRFANDKYSQLMRHPNRIFLSPYPYLSAWGVRACWFFLGGVWVSVGGGGGWGGGLGWRGGGEPAGVGGPPAVGGEGSAPALEGRGIYAELLVEGRREVARV